jgi:energy-coupling factor transporter ATP-binding protein EcfA2
VTPAPPPDRSDQAVFAPDQIDRIAARILTDADGDRPVVLIDGGSGSGKSTLAEALIPVLEKLSAAPAYSAGSSTAWQLVHDEFYPGWAGLSAAWTVVPGQILASRNPGYTRWDWSKAAPGTRRDLDPIAPILIECCGALTPASAPMATTRIWCRLDAGTRKQRALARDGELFARYWAMWAVQEELHRLRNHPERLADLVVQG